MVTEPMIAITGKISRTRMIARAPGTSAAYNSLICSQGLERPGLDLYGATGGHNALVELYRQDLDRTAAEDTATRVAILRDIAAIYRDRAKSESALVTVLTQIIQLDDKDIHAVRELAYRADEAPQKIAPHFRMLVDEPHEVAPADPCEHRFLHSGDIGRARSLIDCREFAEVLSRGKVAKWMKPGGLVRQR